MIIKPEGRTITQLARDNLPALKKTGTDYLLHATVALVAYAVTGDFLLSLSLTLSLLEPAVQAFAFFSP